MMASGGADVHGLAHLEVAVAQRLAAAAHRLLHLHRALAERAEAGRFRHLHAQARHLVQIATIALGELCDLLPQGREGREGGGGVFFSAASP